MKPLRPFCRSFSDDIYRVTFFVVCCADESLIATLKREMRKSLKRPSDAADILRCLERSRTSPGAANGRCYRLEPHINGNLYPVAVIWLAPGADVSVLVHEIWHAVQWIFRYRGVQMDAGEDARENGADEPGAYYFQWVFRSALGWKA